MINLKLTIGFILIIYVTLASNYRLVCYYDSSAENREFYGRFTIADIDPNKCTHLVYAFADISEEHELVSTKKADRQQYWSFNSLKSRNPKLKTLLAVGSLTSDKKKFASVMSPQKHRNKFIQSAIKLLRVYGFDGINLHWRNHVDPGCQKEKEKLSFTLLIKELKEAFDAEGTECDKLIVTATVSPERKTINASYEVPAIAKYLDFINVMTFDFHGPWESVTGHHSPLYPRTQDTGDSTYFNVDSAMHYLVDLGAPPHKLNMGFAAYGRAFTLSSKFVHVGAPVSGPGEEGCYTEKEGFWAFYEVCLYLQDVTSHIINDQMVPYAITENQWVGYDNMESLNTKVSYLKTNNFGGAFVWSLDLDDFSGRFCQQGQYPFVSHLNTLLKSGIPNIVNSATTPNNSQALAPTIHNNKITTLKSETTLTIPVETEKTSSNERTTPDPKSTAFVPTGHLPTKLQTASLLTQTAVPTAASTTLTMNSQKIAVLQVSPSTSTTSTTISSTSTIPSNTSAETAQHLPLVTTRQTTNSNTLSSTVQPKTSLFQSSRTYETTKTRKMFPTTVPLLTKTLSTSSSTPHRHETPATNHSTTSLVPKSTFKMEVTESMIRMTPSTMSPTPTSSPETSHSSSATSSSVLITQSSRTAFPLTKYLMHTSSSSLDGLTSLVPMNSDSPTLNTTSSPTATNGDKVQTSLIKSSSAPSTMTTSPSPTVESTTMTSLSKMSPATFATTTSLQPVIPSSSPHLTTQPVMTSFPLTRPLTRTSLRSLEEPTSIEIISEDSQPLDRTTSPTQTNRDKVQTSQFTSSSAPSTTTTSPSLTVESTTMTSLSKMSSATFATTTSLQPVISSSSPHLTTQPNMRKTPSTTSSSDAAGSTTKATTLLNNSSTRHTTMTSTKTSVLEMPKSVSTISSSMPSTLKSTPSAGTTHSVTSSSSLTHTSVTTTRNSQALNSTTITTSPLLETESLMTTAISTNTLTPVSTPATLRFYSATSPSLITTQTAMPMSTAPSTNSSHHRLDTTLNTTTTAATKNGLQKPISLNSNSPTIQTTLSTAIGSQTPPVVSHTSSTKSQSRHDTQTTTKFNILDFVG